jgi:hypothetical protein
MLDKERLLSFLEHLNKNYNYSKIFDEFNKASKTKLCFKSFACGCMFQVNKIIELLRDSTFDIPESKETCRWYPENAYSSDHYSTSCKEIHYFRGEELESSGFKHCPYCGKPIKEVET